MTARAAALLAALGVAATGCLAGDWSVQAWGEEFIEVGIPASEFADGCRATYAAFEVHLADPALKDGDGDVVATVPGGRLDLAEPGPQPLGDATGVPATTYSRFDYRILPGEDGVSVRAAGSVECGGDEVTFDWTFDEDTRYACVPQLTIPAGGDASTEVTVHGDHLFFEALEAEDASPHGQAFVDADTDGDGVVTLDELAAVRLADIGYDVGSRWQVTDLRAHVAYLVRTVGHVDGEGHCQVLQTF